MSDTTPTLLRRLGPFLRGCVDRAAPLVVTVAGMAIMHRVLVARKHWWATSLVEAEGAGNAYSGAWLASGGWFGTYGLELLSGIGHDAVFALIVGGVAGLLLSRVPVLQAVTILLAALFLAANVEQVQYNHSHVHWAFLGEALNPTFAGASITGTLITNSILIALAGLLGWTLTKRGDRTADRLAIGVVAAAGIAPLGLGSDQGLEFLRTQVLVPELAIGSIPSNFRSFDPDMVGPRAPLPSEAFQPRYNVLVVYLEGVSRSSLERYDLRVLNSLYERGISFENYFGSQVITANGLYATLTGHMPSFLSPYDHWLNTDASSPAASQALPNLFRDSGYGTHFMQSAPLGYMEKSRVLEHLGFTHVHGAETWGEGAHSNGWGVDDRSLMAGVAEEIGTFPEGEPWFVSVLTTGTHPPYNDGSAAGTPTRESAMKAADAAVQELLDRLETQGLMENTVVVITADEGREISHVEDPRRTMAMSRLPLVILHPDASGVSVRAPMTGVDLYGVLQSLAGPISPEAVADELTAPGDFVFGNVLSRRVFWVEETKDRILDCSTVSFACTIYEATGDLFADPLVTVGRARFPELRELVTTHDIAD